MRILYIAPMKNGSITNERVEILKKLGNEVYVFDLQPHYNNFKNPISRRLAFKYNCNFFINKINHEIISFASTITFDVVMINKGIIIKNPTIKKLKVFSKYNYCFHYSADPIAYSYPTKCFLSSIPIYDLCITTKSYEMEIYKKYRPNKLLFLQQGYNEVFLLKAEKIKKYTEPIYDCVFIGRCEKHYVKMIRTVLRVTKNIAIWGPWDKQINEYPDLKMYWKGKSVFGDEYIYSLCLGKICLCFLCKMHPDTCTTRTFEIPAIGTMMLAERTDEHMALYTENVEAVYFSDENELADKAKYYLEHDLERNAIAIKGKNRCIQSGYSNTNRMREMLEFIKGDVHANKLHL